MSFGEREEGERRRAKEIERNKKKKKMHKRIIQLYMWSGTVHRYITNAGGVVMFTYVLQIHFAFNLHNWVE
jgi:hypothetical protein